ncbi:MAG: nucleotidyltransferase domain-containing protein [Pseudomonadota bacterium]
MVRTKNEIKKICADYINLVNKAFYIKQAYLFGSYNNGNPNKYSDLDVGLVSSDFKYIPADIALKILFRLARHVDSIIEPVALTEEGNVLKQLSPEQEQLIIKLNPFYIKARYPDYKEKISLSVNKNFNESIIKETRDFIKWIKQKLS